MATTGASPSRLRRVRQRRRRRAGPGHGREVDRGAAAPRRRAGRLRAQGLQGAGMPRGRLLDGAQLGVPAGGIPTGILHRARRGQGPARQHLAEGPRGDGRRPVHQHPPLDRPRGLLDYETVETGGGTAAHVDLATGNLVWHSVAAREPGPRAVDGDEPHLQLADRPGRERRAGDRARVRRGRPRLLGRASPGSPASTSRSTSPRPRSASSAATSCSPTPTAPATSSRRPATGRSTST